MMRFVPEMPPIPSPDTRPSSPTLPDPAGWPWLLQAAMIGIPPGLLLGFVLFYGFGVFR